MLASIAKRFLGTKNERQLKRMASLVAEVNALEADREALSEAEFPAKTAELKARFEQGAALDSLLPEAFSLVREAAKRTLGLRHFDVQLMGGIALHQGAIAEMRTGEGKTLVATLPAYLNALTGRGVHLVTVNDYLARRDAEWMGPVYRFLGLSVGVVLPRQEVADKRAAYQADITYGTNNEFGFDYLRDNMAFSLEDRVQRPLHYAIVDEVDSILIDEARTPLIISGPAEDSSELYALFNQLIPKLRREADAAEGETVPQGDYLVDEKLRQAELTEEGHQRVEQMLVEQGLLEADASLYAPSNLALLHHVHSALRAHALFHRDIEYIVQNNQIVLVDEHTGRTMPGRRLSEGLHQALEAKEGVPIQAESQTFASTTFQNYFRLYDKLSGMTGTADTEAFEFRQIYGLDVVVIPTNKPTQRVDHNDVVLLTMEEKYEAIIEDILAQQARGAPVLVGTTSIESSELISKALNKRGIGHKVLNAKFHEQEAEIVAQAGRPGAVTIATNMAGRGTDIVLGGNWEAERDELKDPTPERVAELRREWQDRHDRVLAAGGLHIVGTERHESRRIDNQLRGRAGRQGDPGSTRFYLSLEDNLMRLFASDRMRGFMQRLGMERGEAIEHRMVSNAIEKAQRKVEGRNFDIRKQLLEYDDVANEQRQIVYGQRNELLEADDISGTLVAIRKDVIDTVISQFVPPQSIEEQWDIPGLERHLEAEFGVEVPLSAWLEADDSLHEESLRDKIQDAVEAAYSAKAEAIGPQVRRLEKQIMLQILDHLWKEHLATMDHLRQGIHLRAYAQKNPKQEYKRESFELFEGMLNNLQHEVVRVLSRLEVVTEDPAEIERKQREAAARARMQFEHNEASAWNQGEQPQDSAEPTAPGPAQPFVRDGRKVGRNEPCPCGSGKKFKQCHGQLA